ncbi:MULTISPECIES: hypothetical protein [Prauserella salsuginis group]|uniref:Uncharacterized protein n=2 Tax=Prauserella salsuginis group TaxID=2893672 RepID=A0A839XHR9_9PSEU|nr:MULTISPECIES: hypothetical protein [Prauserella salsuginis group]MBB3661299.1 hypothetical protein [Prauserella sediminis]MCR3719221.1 hypothetical protein [Prauserella flava]MCR3735766.1 hypothetical protein [Prauserella salsuginis]
MSDPVLGVPTVEAWAMRNRYTDFLGFLWFLTLGFSALALAIAVGLVFAAWSLLL